MIKKAWRILRSRTLAIWVIIAFVLYAAAATTVSDGNWGVPYTNPAFLALAGLLALSTGACAWERTRAALKSAPLKAPSEAAIARLREHPGLALGVPADADALEAADAALRTMHMRTLSEGDAIEGRVGVAGAFGSPVFHWALTLLFVVVSFGQLTRAEGQMGVVAGASKPDRRSSYGVLDTGPLAGRLTGRIIGVRSIESAYSANRVDQGPTPYVEVRSPDGKSVLASGYAYPNHPIRYMAMLVHSKAEGLAAIVEVSGGGGPLLRSEVFLDFAPDGKSLKPGVLELSGANGESPITVLIQPGAGSTPAAPTARVQVFNGPASKTTSLIRDVTVPVGADVPLIGESKLHIVKLTRYARLSVVNDYSVYFIYLLFGLAALGLTLAVFTPLRGVRVLLVKGADGDRLHVMVRHGRGDPHFPGTVESALRSALGIEESTQ